MHSSRFQLLLWLPPCSCGEAAVDSSRFQLLLRLPEPMAHFVFHVRAEYMNCCFMTLIGAAWFGW